MQYKYKVLPVAGKTAESLERELNAAGDAGFRVAVVAGASDRQAEMLVLELAQDAGGMSSHKPAAAVVPSRLGHYRRV